MGFVYEMGLLTGLGGGQGVRTGVGAPGVVLRGNLQTCNYRLNGSFSKPNHIRALRASPTVKEPGGGGGGGSAFPAFAFPPFPSLPRVPVSVTGDRGRVGSPPGGPGGAAGGAAGRRGGRAPPPRGSRRLCHPVRWSLDTEGGGAALAWDGHTCFPCEPDLDAPVPKGYGVCRRRIRYLPPPPHVAKSSRPLLP